MINNYSAVCTIRGCYVRELSQKHQGLCLAINRS